MEREEVLKNYICMKYKSVRQFTIDKDLKYSTVAAILSRGLGRAGIDTVIEICDALNIDVDALIKKGIIVEKPSENFHIRAQRRLEAYSIFAQILQNSNNFTIDNIPLSPEEGKIFNAGIEALIETIRRLRKLDKENKE